MLSGGHSNLVDPVVSYMKYRNKVIIIEKYGLQCCTNSYTFFGNTLSLPYMHYNPLHR